MSDSVLNFRVCEHMDSGILDKMIGGADKWMGKTGAVVTFNYAAHPMKINSTLGYFAFKLFLMGLHVSKRDMDLSGAEPKGMISIEANANPQPVASKWAMVQVHFAGARFGGGNGPSTSGGQ